MKKIAFFISNLGGGGAEKVFLNLVNHFYSKELPVLLILRHKRGEYLDELNPAIKIAEIGSNNPLKMLYKIISICKKHEISVLISSQRYNNILSILAKKNLCVKVIGREANTFDGIINSSDQNTISTLKNQLVFLLMKALYPLADLIIANSQDTADDILKHIRISRKKVKVINNPIVNDHIFVKGDEAIGNKRFEKLSKPLIIAVGSLTYQKNYEFLVKSFKQVSVSIPDANLVILGKGHLEDNILQLCKKLDIEQRVHLLGFVKNPYKYMKHSDLFVLSSRFEGFGNVIVEALAMGLPVVSTNCPGGPHEILDNGKYGTLVKLNDMKEFSDAIIEKLNSYHDKRISINRSNNFTIEMIADLYCKHIFAI